MIPLNEVPEIEAALLHVRELEDQIKAAADKRDASIDFYKSRIDEAQRVFETDTAQIQFEIDNITIALKRFCDANPPDKRKSHKFAGGSFGYRKQDPRYIIGDSEATADNAALLEFVKTGHQEFLRVKESVDWKKLKSELLSEDGQVCLRDTGEVIADMRAVPQPDRFFVRTTT